MNQPKRSRQGRALDRLNAQLKSGTKVSKEGKVVPLSDKDTKRIEREISTLKSRI